VALVTLGCAKNEADSRRLETLLSKRFLLVDDPSHAEAIVVNTCGFVEAAVSESLACVMELADLPGRPLVVAAGCMASRYGEELAAALPEAGLVVGLDELPRLAEMLDQALSASAAPGGLSLSPVSGQVVHESPPGAADAIAGRDALWAIPPAPSGPTAYLTVSDGCDRRCAYCTIPSIRGPYRSRRPEAILSEARAMVAAGARELILVGQDVGSYGRDLPSRRAGAAGRTDGEHWDLARLIRALSAETGAPGRAGVWIRTLYLQPDSISDAFLDAVADAPGAVPYFDIPMQHVDPAVLRAMARKGSAKRFAALARKIRARVPGAVLRTTVMTGFPGETRPAFEDLERFVSEGHFDYVGVFAYSRESGTPAASMPGRVRSDVACRRRERLALAAEESWRRRSSGLVGRELDVLLEGPSDDPAFDWMGRWYGQAPDVDGIVYWSGPAPGPFVSVTIEGASGYDLTGVASA
jgi:ribosomal protein S12 methylthiotransferase